jgi:hypothetical protein
MRWKIILAFLFLNIILSDVSVFLFLHLDQIIHRDLYGYGLLFDYEWAVPYWTYARLILSLIGLQIVVTIIITMLILGDVHIFEIRRFTKTHTNFKPSSRTLAFIMLSAGSLALVFSINYASKILAFIGLGLILWSVLLFYAVSDKYVAQEGRKLPASKTPED